MRIFVAGASGVIGQALVPLLCQGGHEVAGMTRSPERAEAVAALGAQPVVADVYDVAGLDRAIQVDETARRTVRRARACGGRTRREAGEPLDDDSA